MPNLEFTGERFVPGSADGEIAYEHWHRYAFARRFGTGKRVLDAACGEGYGTALLAGVAAVPNPSAVVQAAVGTPGVCEPAALLASGATALLVPKVKTARATAAIVSSIFPAA